MFKTQFRNLFSTTVQLIATLLANSKEHQERFSFWQFRLFMPCICSVFVSTCLQAILSHWHL